MKVLAPHLSLFYYIFHIVLRTFLLYPGHSARMGCNKCKKQFPGGFGAKNYGGFKREEWIPRSKNEHREEMKMLMACVTKTERSALESIYGTRYTFFHSFKSII